MSKWLAVCFIVHATIIGRSARRNRLKIEQCRAVVLFLMVILILLNSQYFWSFELQAIKPGNNDKRFVCIITNSGHHHSEYFQKFIWPLLSLLVQDVLPLFGTIFSFIISYRNRNRKRKKNFNRELKYLLLPNGLKNLQITVFALCISYFIFVAPRLGYKVYMNVRERMVLTTESKNEDLIAEAVTHVLEGVYVSGKFFIYLIVNSNFRRQFLRYIILIRSSRRNPTIAVLGHQIQFPLTKKLKSPKHLSRDK